MQVTNAGGKPLIQAFIKDMQQMLQSTDRGHEGMRSYGCQRLASEAVPYRRSAVLQIFLAVALSLAFTPCAQGQNSAALQGVRTIEVDSLGSGSGAEAIRQRITDRIEKSGRLKIVQSFSAADAVLRGTSSVWATGTISLNPRSKSASQTIYQGYLSVELVGKGDQTLWSYLVTPSAFHSGSVTNDLADHMVQLLLDAIRSGAPGSTPAAAAASGQRVALHGAGSTLSAPLYQKWIQSSGLPVTYDAVGSEAGIQELAAGKIDFAGSDMPVDEHNRIASVQVTDFPTVLGGVVPIYNLAGFSRTLRLTPQALAGIYSGEIRKWNDPRIAEANHGAHLPDSEITVVHRSDGSGTTYVWTSFLSLASPNWRASAGAGARVTWPTGMGAAGNDGVAELVEKTPNAIGYVELIYAIQHELNYAAVRNPAGEFIKADLASITAAAAGTTPDSGKGFRFSILNAPRKDAYPISTFTWLLVPQQGLTAEKKAAIVDLLNWALTSGQKQCASLGYAPLPREIVASELQTVRALK
jgi:phosphate ABC transporter phosphate-binding protein